MKFSEIKEIASKHADETFNTIIIDSLIISDSYCHHPLPTITLDGSWDTENVRDLIKILERFESGQPDETEGEG